MDVIINVSVIDHQEKIMVTPL